MLDRGSMHVRWQVNACWIGGRCMLDCGSMHVMFTDKSTKCHQPDVNMLILDGR